MDNGLRKNNLAYLLDERTVFSAGVSVLPAVKLASAYTGLLGEGLGLRVFPLPLPGSEKRYQFSVTNTIGIYGGSEHKEEAFEFIVYMLQDDVIGNPNLNLMVGGIPVNKTAYELLFKNMQKKPKIGTRLPEELVADSMQILNNLAWSSLYDRQIEGIVKKYMAMYFSGEMTSAAAARAIDENVNLYLSE
jgi:ABC-type glycerol-3-phosphate transport system substrate-binding protein